MGKQRSVEQRLAELENKKRALLARERKKEQAKDTRCKILIGSMVMNQIFDQRDESGQWLRDWLQRDYSGYVKTKADRALFDELFQQTNTTDSAGE